MQDTNHRNGIIASGADYDAVIVGASLAGCTTAILLGRAGARVALVEKQPDPKAFKRICSHYLQSSAVPTLERLDLLGPIAAAGGTRPYFRAWTRWGWIEPPKDRSVASVNLRRELLDPLVRETAANAPGVELLLGQTAQQLLHGADGAVAGVVVRDKAGTETRLRARLTIGADGRDSRVAELARVPVKTTPHARFAYGGYFEGPPPAGAPDATVWMLDPQFAAAFPTDAGLTFYAAMGTKDRLPEFKRDPAAALVKWCADVPEAPPIRECRLVDQVMGKLDMENRLRRPVAPGLALVGDAALAIDPLWGVGCGFAFQSGEWLADSVGPALLRGEPLETGLERYRKRHARGLNGHARMMVGYATGRKFDAGERMLFAATTRDEQLAVRFDAFGSRRIGPGRMLATTLPRAIVVNTRHALRRGGEEQVAPPSAVAVAPARAQRGSGVSAVAPAPAPLVRRTRIRAGGTQPRLLQAGPADASEAVVFIHGNPGSCDDWERLAGALGASGVRALAFDLPDFGETIAPEGFVHDVPTYAGFVQEALGVLGVERVHLVIHDFGGPIGLVWAAMNVDRVASVTLINTGILPGYRWHRLARIWRRPVVGELFQKITTPGMLRRMLSRQEPLGLPAEFLDRVHYSPRTRRAVLELYRATDDPGAAATEFAAFMASKDIPALVVWGEHDAYLPSSYAERQRDAFPSADVHILSASGHWPFADAPETVERLLVEFVSSVRAAAAAA